MVEKHAGETAAAARLVCCRVCRSADVKRIGEKRGNTVAKTFDYFRCRTCGFMFVEPIVSSAIYDDDYYRGRGADPNVEYSAEYEGKVLYREREYADLVSQVAGFFHRSGLSPQPLRWLDFGCGSGGFLRYLTKMGAINVSGRCLPLECMGTDSGSWVPRLRSAGFRILGADEILAYAGPCFDVISMIEVLEHIPDPVPAIALVSRLLRPGGFLLLTTGNMSGLAARLAGLHYRYHIPEIHVSLFAPPALCHLYGMVGLTPVRVRYGGVVEYKILKSGGCAWYAKLLPRLIKIPGVLRLIDLAYGVSSMPCAFRPGGSFR